MSGHFLGEFLGTLVLILFGGGVVAAVLLEKSKAKGAGWIVITAGWAFAVTFGTFTARAFGAPGALNPVGPLAGMILGNAPVSVGLTQIAAEFLGAFCGATLVWLHYLPHWAETPDQGAKLAVFCTGPAIRDDVNLFGESSARSYSSSSRPWARRRSTVSPAVVGMVVWAIGLSLGATTGYRRPGPRPGPGWPAPCCRLRAGDSDWGYAVPVVGPCVGRCSGRRCSGQCGCGSGLVEWVERRGPAYPLASPPQRLAQATSDSLVAGAWWASRSPLRPRRSTTCGPEPVPFGNSHPRQSEKRRTCSTSQEASCPNSPAWSSATRGAIARAAVAFNTRARSLRANTSSTVRAISCRADHTTSAAVYGNSGCSRSACSGNLRIAMASDPYPFNGSEGSPSRR